MYYGPSGVEVAELRIQSFCHLHFHLHFATLGKKRHHPPQWAMLVIRSLLGKAESVQKAKKNKASV